MLNNLIFFIEINRLLKEATIKLNAYDQTNILEIFPENLHNSPKNSSNKSTAKKVITTISTIPIIATIASTGNNSFMKLSLFLYFSETRCNNTLEIEVAIIARGIESISLDKSKKPVYSDEKNLFIKMTGNK